MTVAAKLEDARDARVKLEDAKAAERYAMVAFVRTARREGWSWERIARAFGLSDTAVRRYYDRNG